MKRKFLFFTGLIVMSMLILSSCKKQDATSLVLDTSKTATITGTVECELDLSNSNSENPPSGTTLFFKVSNSEYMPNADGVKIFETTIGSGGSYSIEIPVTDEGVDITIDGVEFSYNQVQYDESTEDTNFFTFGTAVTGAITNGYYIRDFNYTY